MCMLGIEPESSEGAAGALRHLVNSSALFPLLEGIFLENQPLP